MTLPKKVWLSAGVLIILIIATLVPLVSHQIPESSKPDGTQVEPKRGVVDKILGKYPSCPANLEGILTAPLMKPEDISNLIPLGNVNPPGHTSPVDHIYFDSDNLGKIPLYAPADAWITKVTEISSLQPDGTYKGEEYVITYTICEGLVLDLAGYAGINEALAAELARQSKPNCVRDIKKDGHDSIQGQCYYELNYPVKSGDEIGWVQKHGDKFPFEIWAANYNVPARSDVDWSYYQDDRYAHIMCLFDLYSGDLKKQYYSKFGGMNPLDNSKLGRKYVRRTVEPLCGQVVQDIAGTIQGMWFAVKPSNDQNNKNVGFDPAGLAIIHNNVDPSVGELSLGGFSKPSNEIVYFRPQTSGLIDREPSQVKADGQIYCYNASSGKEHQGQWKVLVQLLDEHRLQAEEQSGSCGDRELFKLQEIYRR